MRNYLIAASILISGCATKTSLTSINYQFIDNPEKYRVELSYKNTTRDTMCFLPEDWPNLGGKINQAGDSIYLVIGSERFPIEDFNTGYCPKGCALRVAPDEQVVGLIPYKDFKLPDRLINEPKRLEFIPKAFKCSRKR